MDLSEVDSSTCDEDKKSKSFMCPFDECKASFGKHSKVLHHVRKHTGERPYVCDEKDCTKAYTNSSHLRRHKAMLHTKKEKVVCTHPGCKLEFYNLSNMKRHVSRAHDVNRKYPHMCDKCNKGFSKKRLLQKHSAVHTGVLGFECTVCNMRFGISTDLYRHKRTHTTYTCECGEQYERWTALLKHKRETHKPDTTCSECGKKFADINILRQHKKKIHVPLENMIVFMCPRDGCLNTYMYKKNLKEHIKYFHDKKPKKKIPCPIEGCGAFLSRMQCLKKHLELHKNGVVRKVNRKKRWDAGMPKKSTVIELSGVSMSHDQNKMLLNNEKVIIEDMIGRRGNTEVYITVTPDIQTDFEHQDEEMDTSESEFRPNHTKVHDHEAPEISGDLNAEASGCEGKKNGNNTLHSQTSGPGISNPVGESKDEEKDISEQDSDEKEIGNEVVLHNALNLDPLKPDPLVNTEPEELDFERECDGNDRTLEERDYGIPVESNEVCEEECSIQKESDSECVDQILLQQVPSDSESYTGKEAEESNSEQIHCNDHMDEELNSVIECEESEGKTQDDQVCSKVVQLQIPDSDVNSQVIIEFENGMDLRPEDFVKT